MKKLILGFTTMLISLFSFGQENPGTAVNIVLSDYFFNTYNSVSCTTASGSLGSSGSGVAVCAGTDANDVWYRFTSNTQAVRITGTTSTFDMVLEVIAVTGMTSMACQDAVAGVGGETLRVSGLTIGQDYYLRIHSSDGAAGSFSFCAEYLPSASVRTGWYPVYTPDDGLPGYKINQNIFRTNYTPYNGLVQATRWMFEDISNGDIFVYIVSGTNGLVSLNTLGGLCFGKTYDVSVEIRVDNFWCGYSVVRQIYTEAVPTTTVEPAYIGLTYDLSQDLKAIFVGAGQNLEWRFITNNNNDTILHSGVNSSSHAYFSEMECMRYNRIYSVEVRAEYCGVFGPWSSPVFIIIESLPYVNVLPQYCNTTQFPGVTLLCDFVEIVDSYAWQLTPIEAGDPTMTPIGPAIVTYSVNTTALYLLPLGLQFGTTYRVGVKPLLGTLDSCNDPQEGDYGFFCPITIGNPSAPPVLPRSVYFDSDARVGELGVFPNPSTNGIVTLSLQDIQVFGEGSVEVYDQLGKLVRADYFSALEEATFIELNLSNQAPGRYSIVLHGNGFKQSTSVVVQ